MIRETSIVIAVGTPAKRGSVSDVAISNGL